MQTSYLVTFTGNGERGEEVVFASTAGEAIALAMPSIRERYPNEDDEIKILAADQMITVFAEDDLL